ncbi:hypothetical protein KGY14_09450 [Ameyamaea chiangmaiensis]|nr:hypothetical protein [Ameyamaea chiangmaiensis]MBS4075414.1 hypothetical protein [Ameyamaea chiangmaiensis]
MDISFLLSCLPDSDLRYVAFVIVACKLVTVCVPAPADTSRWLPLYRLVNAVALNIGWARNRFDPSSAEPEKKR